MTQLTITAADRELLEGILGPFVKLKPARERVALAIIATHAERARHTESARWAKAMREAVGTPYQSEQDERGECGHGITGAYDCIACYDTALIAAIDATEANGGGV